MSRGPLYELYKFYAFSKQTFECTGNDVYSGDRYCGNDRYSGLNPPDDAILFTVSGITAIADKKFEILIKKIKIIFRSDYDFASPAFYNVTLTHAEKTSF